MDNEIHIQFTEKEAGRLLRILVLFELFMVMVFILDAAWGVESPIHKLFNLDSEANIPSWFSACQLSWVGLVFVVLWNDARKRDADHRVVLLLLGLAFLFLSMDEAAQFHEKLSHVLRHIEWVPQFKGGIWIPIYLLIAALMGFAYRHSFIAMWRAHPREAFLMIGGFAIILIGGVGMEGFAQVFLKDGLHPILYKTEVVFEEFFEMVGASILLYGSLLFTIRNQRSINSFLRYTACAPMEIDRNAGIPSDVLEDLQVRPSGPVQPSSSDSRGQ
jgi:hypothetical protein